MDQSIAHNGVCLTVTEILGVEDNLYTYKVTAVAETLEKTNLSSWKAGTFVNIERCLRVGDRLDGHFVQGHVDTIGDVVEIKELAGSWYYYIQFPSEYAALLVPKGSVTLNGVSLTVVDAGREQLSVTIIPFTYEHTTFQYLQEGDKINIECDILGKYFLRQNSLK